jgi:hypothetical protein
MTDVRRGDARYAAADAGVPETTRSVAWAGSLGRAAHWLGEPDPDAAP